MPRKKYKPPEMKPGRERQRNKAVVPVDTVAEVVSNLVAVKRADTKTKFFMYYLFNLPVKECAELAGVPLNTAYGWTSDLRRDPKAAEGLNQILETFPDQYRLACKAKLPWLAELEAKAFNEYEKDPKLLVDKPTLARQVRAAAGVTSEDENRLQIVNIGTLTLAQEYIAAKLEAKQIKCDEVIDAETN